MKKEKIQYSKLIPLFALILFVLCLYKGFEASKESVYDTTVYVTAITVSGGILATSVLYYLKKSQAENTVKLKTLIYQIAVEEKIKYNTEMLELKKRYDADGDDLEYVDLDSNMDEFVSAALSSMADAADEVLSDATSTIELQTF